MPGAGCRRPNRRCRRTSACHRRAARRPCTVPRARHRVPSHRGARTARGAATGAAQRVDSKHISNGHDRPPRIVPPAASSKLISPSQAAQATWARPLVFTNGVFDVLHRGHVTYLAQARALGAALLVAVNSDASARGLGKGPGRPLNHEVDRACVIAALQAVDYVMLFDEPTPCALIERVRPDIYVKGGDYDIESLAETALVRSW